jgi:two-component system NtrC family sensor kinase
MPITKKIRNQTKRSRRAGLRLQGFRELEFRILDVAGRGVLRFDFLREVSSMILDFSGCDAVILQLKEREKCYRCELNRQDPASAHYQVIRCEEDATRKSHGWRLSQQQMNELRAAVMKGQLKTSPPFLTQRGIVWTGGVSSSRPSSKKTGRRSQKRTAALNFPSLALIPVTADEKIIGLLELRSAQRNRFTVQKIKSYAELARMLGVAMVLRRAHIQLRERVKELTCLYGISRLMKRPEVFQEEVLCGITELLPPAFLYPELASSRIVLDGHTYASRGFKEGRHRQAADIVVNGECRGQVEVIYSGSLPETMENPFSREERTLIETVAREVALLVERFKSEQDKIHLQDQLRHADRLATIGQLAAGVAHEINEPLGSILGFAQLVMKSPGLPQQARQDIEKIITATLHAREVVKKLMLFSRQMPPRKGTVNLNQVIEEGLYFLGARCHKAGIELIRELQPDLPHVTADASQLHQVLVNLVVNAVQAMPEGGRLTLRTKCEEEHVSLIVQDTGIGMSDEVMKQIFIPFFTTKEVGEGTGLGLPVVHGIVTSHGGTMRVESQLGQGSRFEIQLPVKFNHR